MKSKFVTNIKRVIRDKSAFTLAEVLITLVIIGVVAALTMPTLIKKYRMHEIETQLKQTHSILQNAMEMARAEYGDPIYWEGLDDHSVANTAFFENNLLKYMKIAKNVPLEDLGYKTPIYDHNGNVFTSITAKGRLLNNGAVITGMQAGYYRNSNNKKVYSDYKLYMDVNGTKGPNTMGKDVFAYIVPLSKGATLGFRVQPFNFDADTVTFNPGEKYTHDELVNRCENVSLKYTTCGTLIQKNNWKFPKDYPFKF